MCFHKRAIYDYCGHAIWGREVRACALQIAFDSGLWPMACDTMNSHPFQTLKVYARCPRCRASKWSLDRKLNKVRHSMMDLKLELDRIKRKNRLSGSASKSSYPAAVGKQVETILGVSCWNKMKRSSYPKQTVCRILSFKNCELKKLCVIEYRHLLSCWISETRIYVLFLTLSAKKKLHT